MTMAEGPVAAPNYTLVIGDKNLSSWSLRPWLALKQCGIPFAETRIRLRQPESKAAILEHSPSGKVPALQTDGLVVCDSLAILEFLAERHPDCGLWPKDAEARALARSIAAEMHAGFPTLRNEMSMDLLARLPTPPIGDDLGSEIARIVAIWRETEAPLRRKRAVPVRRLYQCRRHVRAGGDAVPHLWGRSRPLRRRRNGGRLWGGDPGPAGHGRMDQRGRGRAERAGHGLTAS